MNSELFGPRQILKILPHRYPFLFIDGVREYSFRKFAVCLKNISNSEEVLKGHFPNFPIYPGVLLIEMGFQATHIMLTNMETIKFDEPEFIAPHGFAISVDKFRFHRPALPGDQLIIRSDFETELLQMIKVKVEIHNHQGELIANGKLCVK